MPAVPTPSEPHSRLCCPLPSHLRCRRPCLGFVFYGPVSARPSFASGLRAPPLASQSFQVPWAHFLLLSIPENSSPTSQAFSCLFLKKRSFWPSVIPRTLQGLRSTILNTDFYFFCCILRIEATGKWVKHILTSTGV